jgi:hypothetical protein
MTDLQTAWLRAHPEFEPVGRAGGHSFFDQQGTLDSDGVYTPGHTWLKHRPVGDEPFVVGIKKLRG